MRRTRRLGRNILLAATLVERAVELSLSARNARRSFRKGGVESGRRHFWAMLAVHVGFLSSCLFESSRRRRPSRALFATATGGVLLAQALRYWAIASLGERWNVRVITLPGTPPIVAGPYRYVRHPNYVAVALESIALPLALGAPVTALAFAPLHAAALASRIAIEEHALGESYQRELGQTPRFLPHGLATHDATTQA